MMEAAENMEFEKPVKLKPQIDGDFFVFQVEFTVEDKYRLNVHDHSQKNKKRPAEWRLLVRMFTTCRDRRPRLSEKTKI